MNPSGQRVSRCLRKRMTTSHLQVLGVLASILLVPFHSTSHSQSLSPLSKFVGATIEGVVTTVVDGDTFDIALLDSKRRIRIRVFGIDTPERGEPFGSAALRLARVLLLDQR